MKKIIFIAITLVLLSIELTAAQKMKVAILDFQSRDRASSTIVRSMMHASRSDFITMFRDHETFELINLRTSTSAFNRSSHDNLAFASRDEIMEIGRELEANILIWGEVSEESASEIRIRTSLMSMLTGNISQVNFNARKRTADRVTDITNNLLPRVEDMGLGEVQRVFNIAEQHFNNQNYTAARDSFLRVIELDETNLDAYFYLGYIFFFLNDFEQSEEYYLLGLEINPDEKRILNNLAETQRRNDKPYKAVETLERLSQLEENEVIWLRIGNIYIDLDYIFEAKDAFTEALAINPESETAHYRLGVLLFDNNYFEESLEHLEFIAERHPEDELINRKLTSAYMRTGKLDNAIASYQRQIERDPRNVTAYLNLAGAYRALDRNQEALNTLNTLSEIDKNNPTVFIRKADVLVSLNRLNEAETNANKAREIIPNSHEPYLLLAQVNQVRGYAKYDEFLDLEESAREAFGREADRLIEERDKARNEANRLFNAAKSQLTTALSNTAEPTVQRDINGRIQSLNPLIQETQATFFD